jgi:hypothetical protein
MYRWFLFGIEDIFRKTEIKRTFKFQIQYQNRHFECFSERKMYREVL